MAEVPWGEVRAHHEKELKGVEAGGDSAEVDALLEPAENFRVQGCIFVFVQIFRDDAINLHHLEEVHAEGGEGQEGKVHEIGATNSQED